MTERIHYVFRIPLFVVQPAGFIIAVADVNMYDVASFDYNDENGDGKHCYQLDSGDCSASVLFL